jgi:hypothetical protein
MNLGLFKKPLACGEKGGDEVRMTYETRTRKTGDPPWPCSHCGQPAEIESVEPRRDNDVLLTYWHCEPCQVSAVTPATIREPPTGWVSKRKQ